MVVDDSELVADIVDADVMVDDEVDDKDVALTTTDEIECLEYSYLDTQQLVDIMWLDELNILVEVILFTVSLLIELSQ